MKKKHSINPVAAAIGTAFVVSVAAGSVANATENPFELNELSSGYMVTEETGKCGTLCGGEKPTMSKDGEMHKCGNTCGEVQKCGTLCGGVADQSQGVDVGKDVEVAKCGSICAAVTTN